MHYDGFWVLLGKRSIHFMGTRLTGECPVVELAAGESVHHRLDRGRHPVRTQLRYGVLGAPFPRFLDGRTRSGERIAVQAPGTTSPILNGIHEVRGSIPLISTR